MTFRRAIWLSVALHALLVIFSVTRTFFAPSEPMQLPDAIRVDIVGLPQKMLPDEPLPPEPAPAAAPPPTPAPKAEAAPPAPPPKPEAPKFVEKAKPTKPAPDVKHSQKNALNRLREMDAFAKLEKAAAERKAADAKAAAATAAAQAKAAALIAGHKVTSGNSLTGIPRLEYDRYGAELKARVLANWAVPAWLAESDYSARVRVWLDESGRVTKKQIIRSSGNDVFDAAALESVDKSDPFPAPPDNLRGVLAAEGFTLGLPK